MAAVTAVAATHPDPQVCDEHLGYLRKRVDQMAYPTFRAAGWPIGSGIVESANKLVVEARLKGAGMHWARASVNPMLALRNAVCNDRWREVWTASMTHMRKHGRIVRPITPTDPPELLPSPAPAPEPPVQPLTPKPIHPWRRYPPKRSVAAKS